MNEEGVLKGYTTSEGASETQCLLEAFYRSI